jgi:hypothetical protein
LRNTAAYRNSAHGPYALSNNTCRQFDSALSHTAEKAPSAANLQQSGNVNVFCDAL